MIFDRAAETAPTKAMNPISHRYQLSGRNSRIASRTCGATIRNTPIPDARATTTWTTVRITRWFGNQILLMSSSLPCVRNVHRQRAGHSRAAHGVEALLDDAGVACGDLRPCARVERGRECVVVRARHRPSVRSVAELVIPAGATVEDQVHPGVLALLVVYAAVLHLVLLGLVVLGWFRGCGPGTGRHDPRIPVDDVPGLPVEEPWLEAVLSAVRVPLALAQHSPVVDVDSHRVATLVLPSVRRCSWNCGVIASTSGTC